MNAPAAFKATYSDLRFVKSRKVAQVTLELPIEAASAFVSIFGTPDPSKETWVGIAMLDRANVATPPPEKESEKERRPFSSLQFSQQAALKCQDEAFARFVSERYGENDPTDFVRERCGVDSRSDIKPGTHAARAWIELLAEFDIWMKAPV